MSLNTRGKSRSRPPLRAASETPQLERSQEVLAIEDGDVVPQMTTAKGRVKNVKQKPKMVSGKIQIDREALRSQIRRVKLSADPKRGKGRPPGSLNKSTIAKQAGRVLVPA